MPVTTAIRALLLTALVCLPSVAGAQTEKPSGQSIIMGRVVFADTGRPVRRATLKLYTSMKLAAVRTTAANLRGEFKFSEVVAGSYFVVAEAAGVLYPRSAYAINEFGIGSDTEMDLTQAIVDGQNTVRCEVRAVRAGTIRGTITYADKEPVVNGRIVIFRRKDEVVAPFFAGPESTNDRGMYRLDGLPDGEYFVGVAVGEVTAANAKVREDELGVPPTSYYPGVVSISEAKPIEIQSGSEVTGINITLDEDPVRQISGVIKWRQSGKIAYPAALMLRRKDEPKVALSLWSLYQSMAQDEEEPGYAISKNSSLVSRIFPPFVEVDKQGRWKFTDVPSGAYVITAFGSPPRNEKGPTGEAADDSSSSSRMDPDRMVLTQVEITIEDENQKDVTIELPVGNRILGTVVVEGSERIKVTILVDQPGGSEVLMSVPRFSNDDGTFIIHGIPSGEIILDADVAGCRDFYLKSITLAGRDLLREPLVITEGSEVTDVQISIGAGPAVLTGRLQFKEDASGVAGGGVLLVKGDSKLWRLRSSRRVAMTNAAGEFKLRAAPGEYLVFTWPAGAQPFQSIADFVRAHAATAR